jgi:chitin disaccharide deacetylase
VHVPAAGAPAARSNELLGLAPEARVLIVNCDDFGMSPAINAAVVRSIEEGIGTSCSLMLPCPGAAHAMALLRARPEIPFGIHLTLVCDTDHDRWSPLTAKERVPSLLDDGGELFAPVHVPELLMQARPDEVELEFRAQIDAVMDAGLTPTHLDWHCLADGGRADVFDLTVVLAQEYGLATRAWLERGQELLRRLGVPVVEHEFLDSFGLDVEGKQARYAELLRDLPAGLSEWAVHPGLGDEDSRVRCTDHEFLTSQQARDIVREEGIVLIDYRLLQQAWRPHRRS